MKTNPNIIRALFLKAVKPKKPEFKILFQTGLPSPTKGKNYKIICSSNLVFTKQEILELPDKQADLLEQILKLRKVAKKLKAYESKFKTEQTTDSLELSNSNNHK